MLAIATVHPYDGEAAIEEVTRVAGLGFKVLKLHPHTQKSSSVTVMPFSRATFCIITA
jgi:predicted TIM-barrel fold metal-dependent hydrolase